MSNECQKCSSWLPRAQCDNFKLLLLFNQQPKTQKPLIYYHKWHREAANPHISEAKSAILHTFYNYKMTETINKLSEKLATNFYQSINQFFDYLLELYCITVSSWWGMYSVKSIFNYINWKDKVSPLSRPHFITEDRTSHLFYNEAILFR